MILHIHPVLFNVYLAIILSVIFIMAIGIVFRINTVKGFKALGFAFIFMMVTCFIFLMLIN